MSQDQTDLYIKRVKIQNRWVSGFYQRIRSITIWITLSVFFILPWVKWQGRQAILFDILNRKFYFFGITFWPQDFYFLLLLALASALSLIVITNLAGRIWCGYTCPQTVWTKCYMWIEYMVEGDRMKRMKRDQQPWEWSTLLRRLIKHILWLLLALYTSVTFVGYFVPINDIFYLNVGQWSTFAIIFFTFATYLNAGWMREQICLYICPYARFQSVMFDRNTMIISYDYHRGEPRGSRKISETKKALGDCIDCKLCVQVCPTGIDIRDGLQMACIGCAACVDACNGVMDKIHYPRGLIRYYTENALESKRTQIIRPRLIASMVLLGVIVFVFFGLLYNRIPFQFNVMRDNRQLYRYSANQSIENAYVLTVSNMTQDNQVIKIALSSDKAMQYIGPSQVTINANETETIPVTLIIPLSEITRFSEPVAFELSVVNAPYHIKRASMFFSPKE